MANCESYLLGSIQISTICFPFSNNFNALPRSTMQARANDVLMMSNRPLLRSVSACALPFQHAWRCHLCQAKIRGNSRKCVLHWALRLTASASYTGVLLYLDIIYRSWHWHPVVWEIRSWQPVRPFWFDNVAWASRSQVLQNSFLLSCTFNLHVSTFWF